MQDQIHILLSIPNFISVYYSIFQHDNKVERDKQMKELRIVTDIMTDINTCFVLVTEQYYGTDSMDSTSTCGMMCPTCRGESAKTVNRSFLINHI